MTKNEQSAAFGGLGRWRLAENKKKNIDTQKKKGGEGLAIWAGI